MSVDWALVNRYGIQKDDAGTKWNAGRVTSLLPMANSDLLVGTPNGVWRIAASGTVDSLNLNGWVRDVSDASRSLLAAGPDGGQQVFLLNIQSGLWITDISGNQPLDSPWIQIPVADFGIADRMLVLTDSRRIVVSGNGGLWWTSIPAQGKGAYHWIQADPDECTGLAETADGSVIVAKTGKGLFLGLWTQTGQLQLSPITIAGFDGTTTGPTAIASSPDRTTLYAVVGTNVPRPVDVTVNAFLSSSNGGMAWTLVASPTVTNVLQPPNDLPTVAGAQGGYDRCLAVSTMQSQTVALGWQYGLFISTDGGNTWKQHLTPNFPIPAQDADAGLHVDLWALAFAPTAGGGERLHIGSDGGVASTDGSSTIELGSAFDSGYNKTLTNLKTMDASAQGTTAAAALFDAGVFYCERGPAPGWRIVPGEPGDGQLALLLATGDLLYQTRGGAMGYARPAGGKFTDYGAVPVWNGDPKWKWPNVQVLNPNGLVTPDFQTNWRPIVETVPQPVRYSAVSSSPILAVAAEGAEIYGLFQNARLGCGGILLQAFMGPFFPDPNNLHWELLATLSLNPSAYIRAIASYDGNTIFAGTTDGQILRLTGAGAPAATIVNGLDPNSPAILRLAVDGSAGMRGYAVAASTVLQFSDGAPGRWDSMPNLPRDGYGDLAVDWSSTPPRVVVASTTAVYQPSQGAWPVISGGILPASFQGIAFAGRRLIVATDGASLWGEISIPSPPS